MEDHVAGLVAAIDADDDGAAKRHLVGIFSQILSLGERIATALERQADALE